MNRARNGTLGALLALCIARLWLLPLPSSFWTDEIGTLFVVRMGGAHPSLAVAPQVPASLYFWLPRTVEWVLHRAPAFLSGPGFLEACYRLPSVLCMGAALAVIARVAMRLLGPGAAWVAVFACLAMRGFNYEAADARPYAVGALVGAAAVWASIRWLDRARWRDAALFVVAAAVLWRVQMIYWPFYAVFPVYAAVRIYRRETAVRARDAALVFALLGAALVPVAMHAIALFREARAHVIVALPGASELWRSLKFGLIAACLAGAWLLSKLERREADERRTGVSAWVLLCTWWLAQPLGLFAFSWLTGSSVYVDRYLSIALPGAALVSSACATRLLSGRMLWMGTLLLGLGALLTPGPGWGRRPMHHNSDWRGAAQAVNRLNLGPNLPVMTPSPFIEAQWPAWQPDYALPGFLYADLFAYPVQGTPLLLPYGDSAEAKRYMEDRGKDRLLESRRFVLYGPYGGVRIWERWIEQQVVFSGWRKRRLGDYGDVEAVLYEAL